MRALLIAGLLISLNAFAAPSAKDEACADFTNAAIEDRPDAERINLAMKAINIAYELKYPEATLNDLSTRMQNKIQRKDVSLDGFERLAVFGCTTEISVYDAKPIKAFFETILGEN